MENSSCGNQASEKQKYASSLKACSLLSLLPHYIGETKSHDQTQRLDEEKYTLLSALIKGTTESHDRGYHKE